MTSVARRILRERSGAGPLPVVAGVTFKVIPGFPAYCLGDDSSVWTSNVPRSKYRRPWRRLRPYRSKRGYMSIQIYDALNRKRRFLLHRLVLEVFVGPCPPGMEACHDPDPDTSNNCLDNLRWDTRSGNMQDAIRAGRFTPAASLLHGKGERCPNAKLTEANVIEIKRLLRMKIKQKVIASQFGVQRTTISSIATGANWRHIQ